MNQSVLAEKLTASGVVSKNYTPSDTPLRPDVDSRTTHRAGWPLRNSVPQPSKEGIKALRDSLMLDLTVTTFTEQPAYWGRSLRKGYIRGKWDKRYATLDQIHEFLDIIEHEIPVEPTET